MAVEVGLLGDVEALIDGRMVDIGHARQRCVLVALLVEPNRAVSAEVLIERAWANRYPHRARGALSAYVSRLRRIFAATDEVRIARQPGGYVLTIDPMAVDLHRFYHLISQARTTDRDQEATALFVQALGLWRGEAFATLDTPWINTIRATVEAERLAAELDHNDVRLRLGRHADVLSDLSTHATAHPLDERLAGQLMLALYRSGRQAEALARYEQVRRMLAEELGVDPTAPLRELHQQILTADPALSICTNTSAAPSDGRDKGAAAVSLLERSALLVELDRTLAAGSGGRVVLVAGEAGIGKSALVQRFIQRHEGDVRVLVGLCDPLLTPRALGPVRDIAGQVGGVLAELFTAGAARDEIFAAFLDELAGHHGPQVVVVEDAHWADEATVDLLVMVGRRLDRLRVMLVVTYRDDELGPDHPLRAVLSGAPSDRIVQVRPEPLSEAAVVELAGRAGRAATGLYAITGGNPLLVTEVLAADEPGVPTTIRDLVLARFAALAPEAQEVVRFVSVIPTRTELWVLKEALGPDPAAVEDCAAGGLLVLTDDAVGFRHELMRQAVEESLSALRHEKLNRRALEVLSGAPAADLARLMHHARQSGDVAALLRYAPRAAQEADAAGAHREAVDHYRVALQYADRLPDQQRAELLEGYSRNSLLVGFADEALTARLAALEVWEAIGNARKIGENLSWLSGLYWWAGRRDDAEAAAARAIAVLESTGSGREVAMAYSNSAAWHLLDDKLAAAMECASRAITIARQVGDQDTMASALICVGSARIQGGDETGRAELEQAIEVAIGENLPERAAWALVNLAWYALSFRDYRQARQDLERGLKFTLDRDIAGHAQFLLGMRAWCRLDQGDWPGAEADAREVLGQPEQPGLGVLPALVALGRLQARRGDADATSTLKEAARRASVTSGSHRIAAVTAARAEHAWLRGEPGRAVTEATREFELARRVRHPWLTGELAWWLHRAGQRPDIPAWTAWIAEPYRLLLCGDWCGAAQAWQRLGCPYEQAEALACGDSDSPLRALEIFDRLGAVPAAQRLRQRLRSQGRLA